MKRKIILLRSLLIALVISFSLFGCGKEDAAQITEEPETIQTEEQEPEIQEEADGKEEAAEEVETEQEVEEEKTTATNEPIMNSDPIEQWIYVYQAEDTEQELKFIIYNDNQGYKLVLNDGESYELKKDDYMVIYYPKHKVKIRNLNPNLKKSSKDNSAFTTQMKIAWDDGDKKKEVKLAVLLEGETEERTISCTFYPPSE